MGGVRDHSLSGPAGRRRAIQIRRFDQRTEAAPSGIDAAFERAAGARHRCHELVAMFVVVLEGVARDDRGGPMVGGGDLRVREQLDLHSERLRRGVECLQHLLDRPRSGGLGGSSVERIGIRDLRRIDWCAAGAHLP